MTRRISCLQSALLLAAAWALAAMAPAVAAADRDAAVEEVRAALAKGDYPWYDKSSDSNSLLKPPKPREEGAGDKRYLFSRLATLIVMILVWVALGGLLLLLLHYRRTGDILPQMPDVRQSAPNRGRARHLALPEVAVEGSFGAAAAAAAAAADYKLAVICLFNQQLLLLDERQQLRLAAGRTNRQYIRQLRQPQQQALLRQAVRLFEGIFFGGREAAAADYEAMTAIAQELDRTTRPESG
jgi:hypothetical protein